MQPIRFIHAADLHLDSPFRGLARVSPRLRETMHAATFQALKTIVDHAIDSQSDFILLAGDLYDARDRSLRALVEFRGHMERLAERGIAVYVVHGNHDPLDGWGAEFRMPDNVVVFEGEARAESVLRNGREIARVTGVSYTEERVTKNLARSLRPTPGGAYSIALLHANIGGQSGHADYAPASIAELVEAGFDYWALGHVHTRAVLAESPMIVYPGNPQGRHAREPGPRGCFQVDVDAANRAHLTFIETSAVRWARMDFSIRGYGRMDEFIHGLSDEARRLASEFEGPTVARCRLVGDGPLHADLQRPGVAEDLAEQLSHVIDVESLSTATSREIDRARLMETEPVIGDFLRLIERARGDAAFRDRLMESLSPLFRRRELATPEQDRVLDWIEKAGGLGVDLLLEG